MNPTKTPAVLANPRRALLAKHDDRWNLFYVHEGKLYQHPKVLKAKYNDAVRASKIQVFEGNALHLHNWLEVRDWGVVRYREFFNLVDAERHNHLVAELTNFNPQTAEPIQPGDIGPDADLTDASLADRYPKYYKRIPASWKVIDVYGVHSLFPIQDFSGAIHHSSKKLLVPGVRTGGKSMRKDILEARDTLNRWLELNPEVADEPINQ